MVKKPGVSSDVDPLDRLVSVGWGLDEFQCQKFLSLLEFVNFSEAFDLTSILNAHQLAPEALPAGNIALSAAHS